MTGTAEKDTLLSTYWNWVVCALKLRPGKVNFFVDPGTPVASLSKTLSMATTKSSAGKKKAGSGQGKNKLGVKNSLVNNINAHKKAGTSKPKKNSTVAKKAYEQMEKGWK